MPDRWSEGAAPKTVAQPGFAEENTSVKRCSVKKTQQRWPMWRELRERGVPFGLFALSIVILVSAVVFVGRNVADIQNSYPILRQTQETIENLDHTRSAVDAQSSNFETYLLTNDRRSLTGYRQAVTTVAGSISRLSALSNGDAVLRENLNIVQSDVSTQFLAAEELIGARQRGAGVGSTQEDLDKTEKAVTDVRRVLFDLRTAERTRFVNALGSGQARLSTAVLVGEIGLFLYFAIQCLVFARMDRDAARRRRAETSLVTANQALASSFEKIKRHGELTQAIGALSEVLQSCHSKEEVTAITLKQLRKLIPGASVEIGLYQDGGKRLELYRFPKPNGGIEAAIAPTIMSHECWALRRGQRHFFDTAAGNPRCQHIGDGVTRSLCLPILGQGESLGVMSLFANNEAFDESWEIAYRIVERLALALANLKLQETLRNESVRDPLTGLFNRRYLTESLTQELLRARRYNLALSVLMLDLDHFKALNDNYGHDGGDLALTSFAKILLRCVRSEDVVCRYGGEEFAVVLSGASYELALQRAEEIRASCEQMHILSKGLAGMKVTASIGVATFPANGESMEDLLGAADVALYLAKDSGRNRVVGATAIKREAKGASDGRRVERQATKIVTA